jgi:hypothetical protein
VAFDKKQKRGRLSMTTDHESRRAGRTASARQPHSKSTSARVVENAGELTTEQVDRLRALLPPVPIEPAAGKPL